MNDGRQFLELLDIINTPKGRSSLGRPKKGWSISLPSRNRISA
jgi:hypothetical protein